MPACYIALGGNQGPVRDTLDRSLTALRNEPGFSVGKVSSYWATVAVGEQAGTGFLNAACELSTDLAPLRLLDTLQSMESRLGRIRERHWGPRTLDLDLVFYGSEVIATPRLTVPHPACWYRRFVLDPLVEIAPDFVHPVKRIPVRDLHARLLVRSMRVALAGGAKTERSQLAALLHREFPAVEFADWEPGDDSPTFIVWLGPAAGNETHANLNTPLPGESSDSAVSTSKAVFLALPELPRIDATLSPEPHDVFVRHVLQSALG